MRNRKIQKEARRQKRQLGWGGCIKACAGSNESKEEPLERVDYFGKPDLTPYYAVKNIIREDAQKEQRREMFIRKESVRRAKAMAAAGQL